MTSRVFCEIIKLLIVFAIIFNDLPESVPSPSLTFGWPPINRTPCKNCPGTLRAPFSSVFVVTSVSSPDFRVRLSTTIFPRNTFRRVIPTRTIESFRRKIGWRNEDTRKKRLVNTTWVIAPFYSVWELRALIVAKNDGERY